MPISQLDAVPALVVVDLQQGVVGMRTAHPTADVVARSARLAEAFRAQGLPVVLVNVTGGAPGRTEQRRTASRAAGWAQLVPELGAVESDHLITKQTWGAFRGTGLEKLLRDASVTQVVLTGIATSAGVESTARGAHEAGFNVVLAVDAMTDASPEAHENSVQRIFPRLGETGTTDELLALLERRDAPAA